MKCQTGILMLVLMVMTVSVGAVVRGQRHSRQGVDTAGAC